MKKIAVPINNGCVSSVFDFARTLQLVAVDKEQFVSVDRIDLSDASEWERFNRLIETKPDVLLCGAISRCFYDRIESVGIEVVPLICGPVEQVINAYLGSDLARPEFSLPGCKRGLQCCTHRQQRWRGARR